MRDDRAEARRVHAEEGRRIAEEDRVLAEGQEGIEGSRRAAETDRVTGEDERVAAEEGRVTAGGTSGLAEEGRITGEEGRITAEEGRVTAEGVSGRAEEGRITGEEGREIAEDDRVSAGDKRILAEGGRATAEGDRVSSEDDRVSAETKRERADKLRTFLDRLPLFNAGMVLIMFVVVGVLAIVTITRQGALGEAQRQTRQNTVDIERNFGQAELAACLRDRKTVVLRNRIVRSIRDGHAINRDDKLNQSDAGGGNPMVNRDTARRWQRLIDRTDYFPFRSCKALQEAVGR